MSSADEHLKQDVGAIIANLLFQIAVLKAELDRVRTTGANGQPAPDLVARSAP